jgi:hypothetical protein
MPSAVGCAVKPTALPKGLLGVLCPPMLKVEGTLEPNAGAAVAVAVVPLPGGFSLTMRLLLLLLSGSAGPTKDGCTAVAPAGVPGLGSVKTPLVGACAALVLESSFFSVCSLMVFLAASGRPVLLLPVGAPAPAAAAVPVVAAVGLAVDSVSATSVQSSPVLCCTCVFSTKRGSSTACE